MASMSLKQAISLSGLVFCSITTGFALGQMSGMLESLYSREDGLSLDEEHISWIASSMNVTSLVGFALAAVVPDKIGRRRAYSFFSLPIFLNWLILYYAEDFIFFMISRVFVGIGFGGLMSMVILSTCEYTSPNIRSVSLTMTTSVGPAVGIASGHVFGIIYYWRTVVLIGIIPTALGAILPLFSEESPSWLASQGRLEECDRAFRRLRGQNAEMELQVLKEIEKCKMRREREKKSSANYRKYISVWKEKYFQKLMIMSTVVTVYMVAAGKLLYSTLAITMIQKISGKKDVLLFTLLVDGFVVIGACLSSVLINKLKMRTLLFTAGITANILLLLLSGCIYFEPQEGTFAWINCVTLALFFVVINGGPYAVLDAFVGEMFPLELKAYCFFVSGIVLSIVMFLTVKLADSMLRVLGYHGTFLLNTFVMTLCLSYLWIYMPETKGRTMQEIELYFKNNTFDEVEKVLNGEDVKVLV